MAERSTGFRRKQELHAEVGALAAGLLGAHVHATRCSETCLMSSMSSLYLSLRLLIVLQAAWRQGNRRN